MKLYRLFNPQMNQQSHRNIHNRKDNHYPTRKLVRPLEEIHDRLYTKEHNNFILDNGCKFLCRLSLYKVPVPVKEKGIDGTDKQKQETYLKVNPLVLHIPEIPEPDISRKHKGNHNSDKVCKP